MAARERWTSQERCPRCGAESEVRWSEEDHPWVTWDWGRRVDAISEPLYAVQAGSNSNKLTIYCRCTDEPV